MPCWRRSARRPRRRPDLRVRGSVASGFAVAGVGNAGAPVRLGRDPGRVEPAVQKRRGELPRRRSALLPGTHGPRRHRARPRRARRPTVRHRPPTCRRGARTEGLAARRRAPRPRRVDRDHERRGGLGPPGFPPSRTWPGGTTRRRRTGASSRPPSTVTLPRGPMASSRSPARASLNHLAPGPSPCRTASTAIVVAPASNERIVYRRRTSAPSSSAMPNMRSWPGSYRSPASVSPPNTTRRIEGVSDTAWTTSRSYTSAPMRAGEGPAVACARDHFPTSRRRPPASRPSWSVAAKITRRASTPAERRARRGRQR